MAVIIKSGNDADTYIPVTAGKELTSTSASNISLVKYKIPKKVGKTKSLNTLLFTKIAKKTNPMYAKAPNMLRGNKIFEYQ